MCKQAAPSFDAECARLQKAADVANDLAHERYLTINAAHAALDTAGAPRDLPLAGRVEAVVGEIRAADATNDRLLAEIATLRAAHAAQLATIERLTLALDGEKNNAK